MFTILLASSENTNVVANMWVAVFSPPKAFGGLEFTVSAKHFAGVGERALHNYVE